MNNNIFINEKDNIIIIKIKKHKNKVSKNIVSIIQMNESSSFNNYLPDKMILIDNLDIPTIQIKNDIIEPIHNSYSECDNEYISGKIIQEEKNIELQSNDVKTNGYICIDNKTNSHKTKKKQKKMTCYDKSKLWEIFDNENGTSNKLECVYQNKKENDLCYLCNSILLIMDDGFPTCTNVKCGIIHKNTLDYSPEWSFYGANNKNTNDPTRCGNPINPLLIESSFGCKILCNSKSSYEMKKIRKWTEWQSMPHKEKSLYEEFQFITIMAQNAGVPKIFIDDAMSIHKEISEQKMFRGLNRDGIKAASIYISCRLNGCPRTAHEISEIFHLDKISATAGCSTAVNILHNIERSFEPSQQTDLCTTTPSSFIERYCSKLNINHELTMLSKFVVKKVENQNIILDNTPHAIAAGVIFFVSQNCNLNISKLEIKQICGISEVTINKCFKKLDIFKEKLIPISILNKYK